ncbi:MAG: adenylyltransferase/cytidyltransferase family protein [Candidatus Heimdallarchaeaceae archaeon]|uniref:FAD synthase n=1 Tax=Candidatus Heimdallarchaeum endolithica TaxID=2876572 RepID=A0A9Y1BQ75_9ARCH|nr:MAG: FAD synthase [Candidatus Heimdallarchaeum endolithica]
MTGSIDNLILRHAYCDTLVERKTNSINLARRLELPVKIIQETVKELIKNGSLAKKDEDNISLTEFGRKQISVVMTGGVFDLIHIGHIFTLKQAKLLGDVLVVVITTDNNVRKLKKREPTNSQRDRAQVIAHIKDVDVAVIGNEGDFILTVKQIMPDIIALGYDQKFNEEDLMNKLRENKLEHIKIIRLNQYVPGKSTSKIMQEIIQKNIRM